MDVRTRGNFTTTITDKKKKHNISKNKENTLFKDKNMENKYKKKNFKQLKVNSRVIIL